MDGFIRSETSSATESCYAKRQMGLGARHGHSWCGIARARPSECIAGRAVY